LIMRINENTDTAVVIEIMEPGNALKGKRFSITGHLGRKRDDVVKIIEECGGVFEKQPTYGTHYLITNADWNAGAVKGGKSNKLRKAEANGTKIISEAKFYEMIMQSAEDSIVDPGF